MIRQSLHLRLLAAAMVAILLALFLAWVFMTLLFEWHMERRLKSDMVRDGLRLVAGLELSPDGSLDLKRAPGDSRLDTPAGGYYWEITVGSRVLRSRSLWDGDLTRLTSTPSDHWRMRPSTGPYGESVYVLERRVDADEFSSPVLVQLAQDRGPVLSERTEFGHELAAFLVVLWMVLSLAAWLQVSLGLRPLARIEGDLALLRASPEARLPASKLREVKPLIDSINSLADARERDLTLARQRAGDLAHGLKTPLSAMSAQSRRARAFGAERAADGLDRTIEAMRHTVEAELMRTRVAMIQRQAGGSADFGKTVDNLVTVLEQTDKGGMLAFTLDIPSELRVGVQQHDLYEIMGAVLENAVRYARRQVAVRAQVDGPMIRVQVEDDGPGISEAATRQVLARGGRLDEVGSGTGTGLGLAIAKELLEATGGELSLSRSSLGGLKVGFAWDTSPGRMGKGSA